MFNEKITKAIKAIEEEAQAIEEAYELFENKRDGVIKVAVEC